MLISMCFSVAACGAGSGAAAAESCRAGHSACGVPGASRAAGARLLAQGRSARAALRVRSGKPRPAMPP